MAPAISGAVILAKGFMEYPLSVFLFPDTTKRELKLFRFYRFLWRYGTLYGVNYISPDHSCATILLNHHAADFPLIQALRAGVLHLLNMGPSHLRRLRRISAELEKERKKIMGNQAYSYLAAIATIPECRRQGQASLLLQRLLAMHSGPFYLETFHAPNVRFYEQHHFRLEDTIALPESGLMLYAMRRP